jgi:hypothetical protein
MKIHEMEKKWDAMNGREQWEWIVANPDFGTIYLDNDETMIDPIVDGFDRYFYFHDVVGKECEIPLELLGLRVEVV